MRSASVWGAMRRVVLFVVATAMVVGGTYVLILQVTTWKDIMFRFIVSGVLVTTLGLYLLWNEFLR
jgi:hypothetical protein